MKKYLLSLAVLALVAPGAANAQSGRFELTPFASYRFFSDVSNDTGGAVLYSKLDFEDTFGGGVTFTWQANPRFDGELVYDYSSAEMSAVPYNPSTPRPTTDVAIHNVQVAGLFHFRPPQEKVRPYIGLGLGFSIVDPKADALASATRFTFSVNGGVKMMASDRIGFRLDARWIPTYLFTTEGGYWCDPWYGCWYYGNDHFLNQFDLKAGVIFKF